MSKYWCKVSVNLIEPVVALRLILQHDAAQLVMYGGTVSILKDLSLARHFFHHALL